MTHKMLIARLALTVAAALVGGVNCNGPSGPSPATLTITATGHRRDRQDQPLTATLRTPSGSSQNVTNDSEWSSDNTSVAIISQTGLMTAVGLFGTAKVTARYHLTKAFGVVDTLSTTKQHRSSSRW